MLELKFLCVKSNNVHDVTHVKNCVTMDSCLTLEPIKIPRPQIHTFVELAIIERQEQV